MHLQFYNSFFFTFGEKAEADQEVISYLDTRSREFEVSFIIVLPSIFFYFKKLYLELWFLLLLSFSFSFAMKTWILLLFFNEDRAKVAEANLTQLTMDFSAQQKRWRDKEKVVFCWKKEKQKKGGGKAEIIN